MPIVLYHNFRTDIEGRTPLHFSCKEGNKALVKLILDAANEELTPDEYGCFLNKVIGWDLNGWALCSDERQEKTALNWAVTTQCTDIVLLLLEAGADPNMYKAKGGRYFPTALARAVLTENIDLAKLLLENGKCKAELFINQSCFIYFVHDM